MIQHGTSNHLKLESVLLQRIIDAQRNDEGMKHIHKKMEAGKVNCFRKDDQDIVWFNNRIVVPKNDEICQQILDEAHLSRYSIHPESTNMYHDLKQHYWWTKMKIEIARYVARCDTLQTCQSHTYENCWSITIVTYPNQEMGGYKHGLYCGITQDNKRV
jgi:hypothetical protein